MFLWFSDYSIHLDFEGGGIPFPSLSISCLLPSVPLISRPPFPYLRPLRSRHPHCGISSPSGSGWSQFAQSILVLGINLHQFDCLMANNFLRLLSVKNKVSAIYL